MSQVCDFVGLTQILSSVEILGAALDAFVSLLHVWRLDLAATARRQTHFCRRTKQNIHDVHACIDVTRIYLAMNAYRN